MPTIPEIPFLEAADAAAGVELAGGKAFEFKLLLTT
jgi:hypothetical protein